MIANSKSIRTSVESYYKPTTSFTSRTRNQAFPFEHVPASFGRFGDCIFRVAQFSYRRAGSISLARKNRFSKRRKASFR
jgi:hypothetical protein